MIKATSKYQDVSVAGAIIELLPEKAFYWPSKKLIVISDVHLGKASHFRKNGIAVPAHVHFKDLQIIEDLILRTKAERIIFLGDLFHSDLNVEWGVFSQWISEIKNVEFILIKGNHDILNESSYDDSNLIVKERMEIEGISFTHEREVEDDLYNISGHIHPCVRLTGEAKQALRLPCFYFGRKFGLMPAFGSFTGTHPISVYEGDQVFCIANNQVISLST